MINHRQSGMPWTINPWTDSETEVWSELHPATRRTVTGYGSKIPTDHKVEYAGRLRRVYYTCYSNVAKYFIIVNGEKVTVSA